ncbi:hypothetical protein [Candidatus Vampirococcus lugosii]|uniref:Uncharacterized protein n=1 Tax=Candidatus Vampirococcus lugosii TaxID=2789015 RepID=A0ABS5QN14_9BACT|nr:hypothetical protein [Candidatus Vampirococcus lugosii]MBS8122123.1 hypothetical protein [Candidatus Vampirococcus lugosii]
MIILTEHSAFFAAPYLSEALDCDLYVSNVKFNNFFGKNTNMGIYCGKKTEKITDDEITIIGVHSLEMISNRIINGDFKRVILILCDTNACLKYKWWNDFVLKYNIDLYIMPDKKEFCFVDYKPIYQYMKLDNGLINS